jgi:hypothetical protein
LLGTNVHLLSALLADEGDRHVFGTGKKVGCMTGDNPFGTVTKEDVLESYNIRPAWFLCRGEFAGALGEEEGTNLEAGGCGG